MRLERVADDLIVAIGRQYEANSTILLDGDRALLVDGMGSRKDALELQRYLERDLEKDVRLLVSTHYFSDHLAVFPLFPGVPIVAHRKYREVFDSEAFRSEEEASFFVEPTVLVGENLEIQWGRFHLDIFYSPGHTVGTVAIDIPEADLLLTGDTVVGNLAYLRYGDPVLLKRALTRLRDRKRGRLLSSHQGLSDPARLPRALHYLDALEAEARARGKDIGDVPLERCLPAGVPVTEFERIFHRRNLDLVSEGLLFAQ